MQKSIKKGLNLLQTQNGVDTLHNFPFSVSPSVAVGVVLNNSDDDCFNQTFDFNTILLSPFHVEMIKSLLIDINGSCACESARY